MQCPERLTTWKSVFVGPSCVHVINILILAQGSHNENNSAAGHHPYPLTAQYYLSEMATPQEIEVLVTQDDFDLALSNLRPSVSAGEMEHYRTIQKQFKSQSVVTDARGKGKKF